MIFLIFIYHLYISARIAGQTHTHRIQGYDCYRPTQIDTYNIHETCKTNNDLPVEENFLILQQPKIRTIKGFSCDIQSSKFTYSCGVWNHLKVRAVPDISHPISVSINQCKDILEKRTYQPNPGAEVFPVSLNQINIFKITNIGELVDTDDYLTCKGEDFHHQGRLWTNIVQLQEQQLTLREESFLINNNEVEVLSDHARLPCSSQEKGCVTASKTYVYSDNDNFCNLETVKSVSLSKLSPVLYINREIRIIFNVTNKEILPGCNIKVFHTQYPNIYLAKLNDVDQNMLNPLSAATVDIFAEIQSETDFLSFILSEKDRQLKNFVNEQFCRVNFDSVTDIPTRYVDNQFLIRKGDVVYVFSCKISILDLRSEPYCYEDIPVYHSHGKFVDAQTKLIKMSSTKVNCNPHFPLRVQTTKGWVEISPHIKLIPPPKDFQKERTKNFDPIDLTERGSLYTVDELYHWEEMLVYPNYHKSLLKSLTLGSCVHENICKDSNGILPKYSLDNLISNEIRAYNPWTNIKRFIHENGDILAFIVIVIVIVKLLIDLILIAVTAIKEGPRAVIVLISSFYLQNHLTYSKIRRRNQRLRDLTNDGEGENIEL